MSLTYLDVTSLLRRNQQRQIEVERFLGFIGYIDFVFAESVDLSKPTDTALRLKHVLLLQQANPTQNGLYLVDETAHWQSMIQPPEIGNVVVLNQAWWPEVSQIYQLRAITHESQDWQLLTFENLLSASNFHPITKGV